jgi:hypothetical protein
MTLCGFKEPKINTHNKVTNVGFGVDIPPNSEAED